MSSTTTGKEDNPINNMYILQYMMHTCIYAYIHTCDVYI